jgi:probable F420-dependent oxidoreductase
VQLGTGIERFIDHDAEDPWAGTFQWCSRMEELGFEFGSVGHHSFTEGFFSAAPFTFLAAVAARTSRLRLATGVFLLPLHHPVAVAEQLATLDQLSCGRAIFGVGVGYRDYEYHGFGVARRERARRTDEALQIIRGAFESHRYDFAGEFFTLKHLLVDPLPVQRPHPPIWIGGSSDGALRRAARYGDGWMTDNMLPMSHIRERVETYRSLCQDAGREPGTVVLLRNAWVARTRDEVERDWLPSVIDFHMSYRRAGVELPDADGIYARLDRGERVGLAEFARERGIAGTPEDCIEQIRCWESEAGVDRIHLMLTGPAGYATRMQALELFGREVLPNVISDWRR